VNQYDLRGHPPLSKFLATSASFGHLIPINSRKHVHTSYAHEDNPEGTSTLSTQYKVVRK